VSGIGGVCFFKLLNAKICDLSKHCIYNARCTSGSRGFAPADRFANNGMVGHAVHEQQLRSAAHESSQNRWLLLIPWLVESRLKHRTQC
jgi:hypothetical protein